MNLQVDNILNEFNREVELYKKAEEHSFAKTAPLPTFNQQAKWHFSKKDNEVQLYNPVDEKVYHFNTDNGLADEGVTAAYRAPDKDKKEFNNGNKHLAQIHHSHPGAIYFTVQDGSKNPTYTLRHVDGLKWHFEAKKHKPKPTREKILQVPSEKFSSIKEDILKTATAPWYDPVPYAAKGLEGLGSGLMEIGRPNPLLTTAAGAGLGALYDQAKRGLYNTKEENDQETFGDRARRVLMPAGAAGLTGGLLHSGFPDYYAATR